jgi:hypothetical protein
MTPQQLGAVHQARPFRAFTLHLADGDKLRVPQADFLSHSPNERTLIVYAEDDSFSIVDLLLVTRLEVHNGAGTAPDGGE